MIFAALINRLDKSGYAIGLVSFLDLAFTAARRPTFCWLYRECAAIAPIALNFLPVCKVLLSIDAFLSADNPGASSVDAKDSFTYKLCLKLIFIFSSSSSLSDIRAINSEQASNKLSYETLLYLFPLSAS